MGQAGEGRTPPRRVFALLCSVYSASRPNKEAKGRGAGSALSPDTGQQQLEKQDPEQRQLLETAGDTRYSQQQLSR